MPDKGARLLIVDDNKVNRLLLARNVELLGYQAQLAENGRIAMEMLRDGTFDLLLLDIEMPEMDGFEVLAALKTDANLRDMPVIVTSSVEGLDNIVRCIELGAEDYLGKPVNPTLLKARLGSSLEKKQLRDEQQNLFKRFATSEVVQDLQESGFAIGGRRVTASVLFCDIRSFTTLSEDQPPEETIDLLNAYYTLMFEAIASHGGIVTLMIGDGLMAVFGAPKELANPGKHAVAAAQEMVAMIDQFSQDREASGKVGVQMGVGIATGEVVAGYAGTQDRATYTCIGKTVNLAARLESHTKVVGCEILIDRGTRAGLDEGISLEPVDQVTLKGFAESLDIFSVL